MMPDTSLVDIGACAGAAIAALIAGLGLRKGEKDKTSLPAPNDATSAGVFVGLDAQTERAILEELRDMHADQVAWRKEDLDSRHAEKIKGLESRIVELQQGQGRTHGTQDVMLADLRELLVRIDKAENHRVRDRASDRAEDGKPEVGDL